MPLILAIEPDRDQATQVNAIVRGRLRAELVLEASAERALAELGDRVPDLILTAALLSPKDEAALAERLRALDSAAAHVHTLTIPVLAAPRSRPRIGGMLSALRRDKQAASELDGCDPAVFAEQCATYLERAMEERQAAVAAHDEPAASHHEDDAPAAVAQESIEAHEPETVPSMNVDDESSLSSEYDESVFASAIDTVIEATQGEQLAASSGEDETVAIDAPIADEPVEPPVVELAAADPHRDQPSEPPSAEEIADDPMTEDIADEPPAVERRDENQRKPWIAEPPPAVEERVECSVEELHVDAIEPAAAAVPVIEDAPATAPGDALLEDSPLFELVQESESDPALENHDDLEKYIELDLSEFLDQSNAPILHAVGGTDVGRSSPSPSSPDLESMAASAAPADFRSEQPGTRPLAVRTLEPPAAAPEEDDWLQVVEALRRDVERLDATPVAPMRQAKTLKKGARKLKTKPVQDEWGFFDPEQCGFAALLAKLDEVAASNDPKRRRTRR